MNDLVFINVKNFIYENSEGFTVGGLELQLKNTEIELDTYINNKSVWEYFGLVFKLSLIGRPYFRKKENFTDHDDFVKKANEYLRLIDSFLFFSWFVKDNSASSSQIGIYYKTTERYPKVAILGMNSGYSGANGDHDDVAFTPEDIFKTDEIREQYLSLGNEPVKEHKYESDLNKVQKGPGLFRPYNAMSRIQRAVQFLKEARRSSLLPSKIAFYVLILECLFSADDKIEVTHTLSERVALYLEDTFEGRLKVYNEVKGYYAVRSKYVHGQELTSSTNTIKSLQDISVQLDNLIRRILKKVIMEDSSIFLKSEKELRAWFLELALKPTVNTQD